MDYLILVNKDNMLDKDYIPENLVDCGSMYKTGILINKDVLLAFNKMKMDMLEYGYHIDIMSGYRDYKYQEKLYNDLLNKKGYIYTFRSVAVPLASEHQTGLAIDICVYRDDKCFIEHELDDFEEIEWIHKNCYKYGFILRYPLGSEDITGYNYESWHLRYVGNGVSEYIYNNNLTLEEYKLNN